MRMVYLKWFELHNQQQISLRRNTRRTRYEVLVSISLKLNVINLSCHKSRYYFSQARGNILFHCLFLLCYKHHQTLMKQYLIKVSFFLQSSQELSQYSERSESQTSFDQYNSQSSVFSSGCSTPATQTPTASPLPAGTDYFSKNDEVYIGFY